MLSRPKEANCSEGGQEYCPRCGTLSYSTPLTSAGAPFCETMRIERRRSKTWQTCLDSAAARSSGVHARPITNLQALQTESIVPSQIHHRKYGRRSYNCKLDFGTKPLTMVSAMACCRQLASVLSVIRWLPSQTYPSRTKRGSPCEPPLAAVRAPVRFGNTVGLQQLGSFWDQKESVQLPVV